MLLLTTNAYAGLIVVENLSEDADLDNLNKAFSTIKNEINGSIEAANIANDTLTEATMADEINPRVRWDESFADYTLSGQLPVTDTDLTSDIGLGTSYVKGYRIVTTATAHTYTASRDTWVYIDINGTFQFQIVANDAAQPTTPANSLLLARVVTTTVISEVEDKRITTLAISVEDFFIKGMDLISGDIDEISVDIGVLHIGTTVINKTAKVGLQLYDASDWYDNSVDSYSAAAGWNYIGISEAGDVKFLGANAPNRSDSSGNTGGKFYYYYDGTTYWRVIGETIVNKQDLFNHKYQQGNVNFLGQAEIIVSAVSAGWSGATSCSAGIPATAETGIFGAAVSDNAARAFIAIRPHGGGTELPTAGTGSGSGGIEFGITAGTIDWGAAELHSATDTSQQINYANEADDTDCEIRVKGYIGFLRD